MARRIGNWTNPNTGEADWFEPETINLIALQPKMVLRVGDTVQTAVDFRLGNINETKKITLFAEYTSNGKQYVSKTIEVDEVEFGEQFIQKVYAERALDEADIVKSMKDQCMEDLTKRLMDAGILLGGMQLAGFGFVFAEGDRVMTIDGLDFEYVIRENQGVKNVVLHNCVGQVELSSLDRPNIEFYTGQYKIVAVTPKVTKSVESKIKEYTIEVKDFVVTPNTTMPEHKAYEKINVNDDEFIDAFIKERKTLLDDIFGRDDDDDRIDDILDL
jgi:hypothetical protein